MKNLTLPGEWIRSHRRYEVEGGYGANALAEMLLGAEVRINGPAPWDIQIRDSRFFRRVLADGALGLGEAYMDGWWEVDRLDDFFYRARRALLDQRIDDWGTWWLGITSRILNLQSCLRARRVAIEHYDLGNDLYSAMLGPSMQYSCAYWTGASSLEEAQRNKLDLICRKLGLMPGMRVLDLGGGFGGFSQMAAEKYGCEVVTYNISQQQLAYARDVCRGLPVRFEQKDYREAIEEKRPFDRIASVGMCEHIGLKNYRIFCETVHRTLKPGGLFLLHTIGGNQSLRYTDPWMHKYIFPNGMIPSIAQLGRAMEGLWVVEDWHSFGSDYDLTLMAWWHNFVLAWPRLRHKYNDRFFRMWKYYLQACAGSFRSRHLQLWQIVLSKGDIPGYSAVR